MLRYPEEEFVHLTMRSPPTSAHIATRSCHTPEEAERPYAPLSSKRWDLRDKPCCGLPQWPHPLQLWAAERVWGAVYEMEQFTRVFCRPSWPESPQREHQYRRYSPDYHRSKPVIHQIHITLCIQDMKQIYLHNFGQFYFSALLQTGCIFWNIFLLCQLG
jgi:hypothetical protein